MNKILLLACSLLMGAASVQAQQIAEIRFQDGRLTMDNEDELGCTFGANKSKKKSATATTTSNVGAPKAPAYNHDAAMLRVSKEEDDWYLEVPDSIVGRLLLAVTRFTATPAGIGAYGGEEVRHATVYFEKTPDKKNLLLRNRIQYMSADTLDAISKAVKASSSDPIVGSFKIEKSADNKNKIKITSTLLGDNLFSLSSSQKKSINATSLNNQLSYIESVHSYPINTEVRTVRTFNVSGLSTNTMTFGLNTSFILLPKEPMQPRYFDPRVGFFTDSYYLLSDNQQQVERNTMITRWRLEPKNAEDAKRQQNGELIEPKKQIVYYIDPATPKQWRPYLIAGVKDWNVAFEQAGWKNAITALEWPENDSTMSMEDARYSVIMYLASDIANAYGPQNHDPRSGEILESHVGWYHNVMTLVHDWYQVQCAAIDPEARHAKFSTELMGELIRFVSSHEIGHTLGLRHNFGSSSTVPIDSLRNNAFLTRMGHTPSIMDYARFNYVAQPEDGIEVKNLFPRVNDYDKWAIEWGYKPMYDAVNADDERFKLIPMVSKRLDANHRLWWGDGEGFRRDARCQTEDLSDNAEAAGELGIANLKRIIPNLQQWNYWGSDVNDENLENMYTAVCNQYLRYCVHVINNMLGINRNVIASDQKGKFYEWAPVEKVEAVIPWIDKYIFQEQAWLVDLPYADRVYPKRQLKLEQIAGGLISQLTMGGIIAAINPRYGSARYVADLNKIVFGNYNTSAPLTEWQRFVQRTYVDNICATYTASKAGVGGDALAAILSTIKTLDKKLSNVKNSDLATEIHYQGLSDRIKRTLSNKSDNK